MSDLEELAIRAAKGNNGGEWKTHYTEEQKEYWRSFVRDLQVLLWQPIETAPEDKSILLWWRPRTDNQLAETTVIWQISSHEPGKWWNGQRAEYQDAWHVTHWMPLPCSPEIKP